MTSRFRTSRAQISLPRALSKLGVASRSLACRMIESGLVSVNGRKVRSTEVWVDPRSDRIAVEGRDVKAPARLYLMFNKPAGTVTTRSDERGRKTIYDVIPAVYRHLFPVGRLDKETTGLLLLTNDTEFGEKVTSPEHALPKRYTVSLNKPLTERDRTVLESPMTLDDGTRLLPARVETTDDPRDVVITIVEGKNRQIRKMFGAVGYTVITLHRACIGVLAVAGLAPGGVRELTAQEVVALVPAVRARL